MNIKTCTKCVMDTTDPLIFFDENGVCNYCRIVVPYQLSFDYSKQPEKLTRLLSKIKNKKMVLGISGVDSSYTAWMTYLFGLDVHLITLDNGYDTHQVKHNVKAVAKRTGFPLEERKVNFDDFKKVQLAYLDAGVINFEAPTDHFLRNTMVLFAEEIGASYWITGTNMATESINPRAWGYSNTDVVNIRNILKTRGINYKELDLPFMGIWKSKWYETIKRIKRIPLLDYVPYNRAEAVRILEIECGFLDYGRKHCENINTRYFQQKLMYDRYGYDKRKPHLSSLILSGQMTREHALEELKEPLYTPEELRDDMDFMNEKLGVNDQFWEEYIKRPDVPHKTFGTDYKHLVLATMVFNPRKILNRVVRVAKSKVRR